MSETEFEESSGNVFADLGLANPEERSLKAELAWKLKDAIDERGWKQADAAQAIGCTQAEVSDLRRGRTTRFSIDRLLRFLKNLGQEPRIEFGLPRATEGAAAEAASVGGTVGSQASEGHGDYRALVNEIRALRIEVARSEARIADTVAERVYRMLVAYFSATPIIAAVTERGALTPLVKVPELRSEDITLFNVSTGNLRPSQEFSEYKFFAPATMMHSRSVENRDPEPPYNTAPTRRRHA